MNVVAEMLQEWNELGGAVQEQAFAVWNGEPVYEQNANALKEIRDWAEKWGSESLSDTDSHIQRLWESLLYDPDEWEDGDDENLRWPEA